MRPGKSTVRCHRRPSCCRRAGWNCSPPLPQAGALGSAVALAQELGRIHAAGKIHGALSPAAIVLTEGGLELLPADTPGEVTAYTAPEVLAGASRQGINDVFSFGAVVYEMLSGRRAFD